MSLGSGRSRALRPTLDSSTIVTDTFHILGSPPPPCPCTHRPGCQRLTLLSCHGSSVSCKRKGKNSANSLLIRIYRGSIFYDLKTSHFSQRKHARHFLVEFNERRLSGSGGRRGVDIVVVWVAARRVASCWDNTDGQLTSREDTADLCGRSGQ